MLELTFSSKLNQGSYIISVAKTASKKIGALIRSMNGLVLLVATLNCWRSYKNRYKELLVLPLLPVLNPWLIVEI